MVKVCYVNITAEEVSGPFLSVLDKLFQKAARPDTQVDVKCVKPGLNRSPYISYAYLQFLNKGSIIERIIEAEREGYDAAMVGCFLDPGVREARSIVNIPVIGLGESTIHFACQLGHRLAIIAPGERRLIPEYEDNLALYGVKERTIVNPIRMVNLERRTWLEGIDNPNLVASAVLEKARECASDGAEVVVVGCNALGPFCTLSGLVEIEERHVPIVDCTSIALKMAETIVDIHSRLGLPFISRASKYALPEEEDVRKVRAIFDLKEPAKID
ncbi:aspartate/glutamate racemase family protein [Chloroflexota bacterium]